MAAITTPVDALSLLPGVSLDELNSVAALQSRRDRKYLLPFGELEGLIGDLGAQVQALDIDGQRAFGYESIYFDTPDFRSYVDAARSRPRRRKVRTRMYLDSGDCTLEVKTRDRHEHTVKHRRPYEAEKRQTLDSEAHEFIVETSGGDWPVESLRPTLTTSYHRSTLLVGASASRVTIDTGLSCHGPNGDRIVRLDHVIVETKSDTGPSIVDRLLWARRHRPIKISKYCVGLAVLDPRLPANKWNRLLRRDFGWEPDRS